MPPVPPTGPPSAWAGRAYLLLAAVDVALAVSGQRGPRRLTKPLLMPVLAVGRDRRTQVALALSAAGDVALLGRGPRAFRAGLGAFLAAHVAWVPALRARPRRPAGGALRRRPAAALPYLAAWAGLTAYLWPRAGADRVPVAVYGAALTATALAAADTGDRATAAGGALFVGSDTLLALERFTALRLPGHAGLVMSTYTTASWLLARRG